MSPDDRRVTVSWVQELVTTGMPRGIAERHESILQGTPYFAAVIDAVRSPSRTVYLWGPNGNGKTHMGSWLFSTRHAMAMHRYHRDMTTKLSGWYPSARWATSNMITAALKNFSARNFDFEREQRIYTTPDLLLIDDLWADRATEVDVQNIVEIVDVRTANGRRTILTGNHSPIDIETRFSRRFADRLYDGLMIEFTGASHRMMRTVAE